MQVVPSFLKLPRYRADGFPIFPKNVKDDYAEIALWMEHLLTDMVTDMVTNKGMLTD